MKSTSDLKREYGRKQGEYQTALERHRETREALRLAERARDDAWDAWQVRLGRRDQARAMAPRPARWWVP